MQSDSNYSLSKYSASGTWLLHVVAYKEWAAIGQLSKDKLYKDKLTHPSAREQPALPDGLNA